MVLVMAMTEFFGASCMTLIVIWRTTVALLPEAGMFIFMYNIAGGTVCVPCTEIGASYCLLKVLAVNPITVRWHGAKLCQFFCNFARKN